MAHKKHPVFRWLYNCIAGFSLLLCVATIALWVRSYHRVDKSVYWVDWLESRYRNVPIGIRGYQAGSAAGLIYIRLDGNVAGDMTHRLGFASLSAADLGKPPRWFDYAYGKDHTGKNYWAVEFPHWFLALLFAILPAIWFIGFIRRRARFTARGFLVMEKNPES